MTIIITKNEGGDIDVNIEELANLSDVIGVLEHVKMELWRDACEEKEKGSKIA